MSLSKSIAEAAGFTKCHDIKDPGYMHNSKLHAQYKLTWEYKVTVRLHIMYIILYFQYMSDYTQYKFTVSFQYNYVRLHVTCYQ